MRRARRWALLLMLGLVGAAVAGRLALFLVPMPSALTSEAPTSIVLLDRNGRLLREAWTDERGAARHVALERVSSWAVQATLAAEDAGFYRHCGVDLLATLRAAVTNLSAGETIAGGSTLTQQVVSDACGRPGGLGGKALEALRALRLETMESKARILERYLNTVPYGHNTRGIESASRYYFGRPASQLSLAQSAFLAAVPRGPDFYDPLRHADRTRERQRWILARMEALGFIDGDSRRRAEDEPVEAAAHRDEFRAPHFTEMVLRSLPSACREVRTSLDVALQDEVERIVRSRSRALADRGVNGAAVVVLDNATGEVRALVGSPDFFDEAADGQVNLALSLRQPGSALKPFTYSLALEKGMTPATVLPDLPVRYPTRNGEFAPVNYDETFHGPVRLRSALACSYNVPAVRVLRDLGVPALLERLHGFGMRSLDRTAEHYGLALTLGDGEVTLLELAQGYRALARGGVWSEHRLWRDGATDASSRGVAAPPRDAARTSDATSRRVVSRRVAFLLTDILSDAAARAPAFGRDSVLALPFPCAVKTGTSRAYRDNWTVGYTTRFTVGVWVGHTRGLPMNEVSGVTGAGPIFRDVMLALHRESRPTAFKRPDGLTRAVVCEASGMVAGPDCPGTLAEWFVSGTVPRERCVVHRRVAGRVYEVYPSLYARWAADQGLPVPPAGGPEDPSAPLRITSPTEGDVFVLDPTVERRLQCLRLDASATSVEWMVDGRAVPSGDWPLARGRHVAEARSRDGRTSRVAFEVR